MTNENVNTSPPVNAEAAISIAPNGLEASVKISPPQNGGADLNYVALKIFLAKNRIVYGINDAVLKSMGENPAYNKEMVIARGVPSEDGIDARLVYHVETDRQIRPKEKEDGSVDFKDLGIIQDVKRGHLLCEKIAATPGRDGTDVRGTVIKANPGKDLSLPDGKNTTVSEDKLKLLAAVDGHVSITAGKINIMDTYVVNGSISVETGNIDFSGNVVVRGDVSQGYSLKATGDVTVEGVVEAAQVTTGGNLIIRGGFLGGDNGSLYVGGNAICRFIESGNVVANGDLETTYIMNATVKCGGKINLIGKGLIRGGYVSSRISVTAAHLGSPKAASANTVIEIGNDPFLVERFEKLSKEAEEHEKNITSLETMEAQLEKIKAAGQLSPEKNKQLEKVKAHLENLRPTYKDIQEALATLSVQMSTLGRGTVNVKQTAYMGLKIIIGDETLILQKDHDHVSFYNGAEGLAFVPFIKQ